MESLDGWGYEWGWGDGSDWNNDPYGAMDRQLCGYGRLWYGMNEIVILSFLETLLLMVDHD